MISLVRALQSYEHGVNTFDTANLYSNGLSEVYLGRAIKALNLPREEIVVMTKVCSFWPGIDTRVEILGLMPAYRCTVLSEKLWGRLCGERRAQSSTR